MERLNVKNYNIGNLKLTKPYTRPTGYNSKILYDAKDFKIQSPLCTVKEIDTKGQKPFIKISFKISNNFNHFQFFSNIKEICIEHLLKCITNLSEEEIRKNFISTIEKNSDSEMIIKIKLNKSTLYFNKEKKEIHGLEIKPDDKVILLLKTNGLVWDSVSASQVWICLQCLKFK